jgi:C4-dicarboxylate transporter DctM subunit
LLTPPVGMNLFVVARSGQGSLQEAIKGVLPFVGLLALLLVMLIFVPQISLWLPAQMP